MKLFETKYNTLILSERDMYAIYRLELLGVKCLPLILDIESYSKNIDDTDINIFEHIYNNIIRYGLSVEDYPDEQEVQKICGYIDLDELVPRLKRYLKTLDSTDDLYIRDDNTRSEDEIFSVEDIDAIVNLVKYGLDYDTLIRNYISNRITIQELNLKYDQNTILAYFNKLYCFYLTDGDSYRKDTVFLRLCELLGLDMDKTLHNIEDCLTRDIVPLYSGKSKEPLAMFHVFERTFYNRREGSRKYN